jgi:hypothetical protein
MYVERKWGEGFLTKDYGGRVGTKIMVEGLEPRILEKNGRGQFFSLEYTMSGCNK